MTTYDNMDDEQGYPKSNPSIYETSIYGWIHAKSHGKSNDNMDDKQGLPHGFQASSCSPQSPTSPGRGVVLAKSALPACANLRNPRRGGPNMGITLNQSPKYG